jgi:ribosomal protein S1
VVSGRVSAVRSFGLFIELPGTTQLGFLVFPDLDPGGTPVSPGSDAVPSEGEMIEVVVVGHERERQRFWLSCRLDRYPDQEDA